MNNFYSANGKLSKFNIIENFDSPNDGVSLISHLIEFENHKNKVSELETNINEFDLLVINRINEVKGLLPYNNDKYSKIISDKSNDWILENDDNIININFTGIFENVPQVITDISATNNYNLQFDKLVYNLNKDGFKFSLKISNDLNIDNFNVANNTNFVDVNDLIKNTFTLNYILIG